MVDGGVEDYLGTWKLSDKKGGRSFTFFLSLRQSSHFDNVNLPRGCLFPSTDGPGTLQVSMPEASIAAVVGDKAMPTDEVCQADIGLSGTRFAGI